jgi:DNA-binding NarL/FixJ family response regulator
MAEKPTLLIVDDEKTTREGLRAALEDRYDVYHCRGRAGGDEFTGERKL